jgi:hypothetical protein
VPEASTRACCHRGQKAFGKSYGAWSAAWWQYVESQPQTPTSPNPLNDPTGAVCNEGQSGPVFFLVGALGSGVAHRPRCTVPRGRALFFPLVNAFDVHVPPDGLNTPRKVWNDLHNLPNSFGVSRLYAAVDGVRVRNLNPAHTPYRACAGPVARCTARSFSLAFPDNNLFGLPRGAYAPTVADGVYLLLKPLAPGTHTIRFGGVGSFAGGAFSQHITYHLTVLN